MRTILVTVIAIAVVIDSIAADDGRYHPQEYGDKKIQAAYQGRYYSPLNGPYKSLIERNGKFGSIYNAYQPLNVKALNQELLAPFVKYGDREDPAALASTLKAVTYSTPYTPVVSTYRPVVYSTTVKPYKIQYVADRSANIIKQENDIDTNAYNYSYEADNGIAVGESGSVEPTVKGAGTRVRGFYEYIGDDGVKYRVDYTADENGFRPVGAHLPQN